MLAVNRLHGKFAGTVSRNSHIFCGWVGIIMMKVTENALVLLQAFQYM
jgi:hypothetical protein